MPFKKGNKVNLGRRNQKDISGQKFGKLTALKFSHRKNKTYYWLFKCDCGTKKIISKSVVVCGITRSCGCLSKNPIIGKRFGKLVVLRLYRKKKIKRGYGYYFLCKCDCGNEIITSRFNLIGGSTKSCGCLKKGKNHYNFVFSNLTYFT